MNFSFIKTHSALVSLLTLLVMIVGVYFFVIRPLRTMITNQATSIQEFYAKEENQAKQVNRLPELKKQYLMIEEKAPALDILRNEDQIVGFIQTLEEVASETHVTLTIASKDNGTITEAKKKVPVKTAKPSEASDAENTTDVKKQVRNNDILANLPFDRYLRLSIVVSGTYNDIVAFVYKTDTLSVGLDVVGMEIKRVEIEKDSKKSQGNTSPFLPLLAIGTSAGETTQPVAEETIDALEATLDILVYVNK